MLRTIAIASMIILPFLLIGEDARSQAAAGKMGGAVACPPGTCSKIGTAFAKDARYCSAANCKNLHQRK